jgi:hypothetical protein
MEPEFGYGPVDENYEPRHAILGRRHEKIFIAPNLSLQFVSPRRVRRWRGFDGAHAACGHSLFRHPGTTTPTAGTGFNFTVAALDASNATVNSYAGTVHFSSSDSQAVLPANSSLTSGTGTLSATLKTSGIQIITAADTASSSIASNSSPTTVSAAATSQFSVTAPASANTGRAFNFSVTAKDPFSNTVSTYSGTLHFTSSDAKAALPGNATLTNGTGTFSATLNTATNQTISATDTVMVSITGTSTSISVSSNASFNLTITSGPLPPGPFGRQYGQPHGRSGATYFQLTASGGTGSLSWSWAATQGSSLPPGLSCCDLFLGPPQDRTGVRGAIYGVPTALETFHVVVSVKDSGSPSAVGSADYDIVINPPPSPESICLREGLDCAPLPKVVDTSLQIRPSRISSLLLPRISISERRTTYRA